MNQADSKQTGQRNALHFPCGTGQKPIGFVSVAGGSTVGLGAKGVSTMIDSSHAATVFFRAVGSAPAAGAFAVYPQSQDPTLRSCDYKLADRPAAHRLASFAKSAVAGDGIATPAQLESDSTIYLVSDDPLDASEVIVTIDVSGPAVRTAVVPANVHETVSIEVFLLKGSGHVIEVVVMPPA